MRTVLILLTSFLFMGSAASQPVDPRSYCDHPLYPIRMTANGSSTWHYLSGDEMIERKVSAITPFDSVSALALINTGVSSEGSLPTLLHCTSDGLALLLPDQFTLPLPIGDGDLEVEFSVNEQEGLLLPAAPIAVGDSWTESYELSVAIVQSDEIKARFMASVAVESTVLANDEAISVPAGEFEDAWLIEREFTVTYKIGLRALPPRTIVHLWYLVDGIGLVSQVADRIPLDLDDYELPESES